MNREKLLFEKLLSGEHSSAIGLIVAGANPNGLLPEGAAPIHLAAGLDSVPCDLVKILLRYGGEPNLQYSHTTTLRSGVRVLDGSSYEEYSIGLRAEELAGHYTTTTNKDSQLSSEGDTPLHVSAAYGRCDVLRLLLQSGANPDVYNQDGQRAADLARQSGCMECMLLLQDFTEQEDEGLQDDEVTAFTIRPFEPEAQLPFSLSLSDRSQDITLSWKGNESVQEGDGTLSSTSSFHTCPSDTDVTLLAPESYKENVASTTPRGKTITTFNHDLENQIKSIDENVLVDDSISSCGTDGFLPTDFDSDDLSIDLKKHVDHSSMSMSTDHSTQLASAMKSGNESNPHGLQESDISTDPAYSGWFNQLRNLFRPPANQPTLPDTPHSSALSATEHVTSASHSKPQMQDKSSDNKTTRCINFDNRRVDKASEIYTSDESEAEYRKQGYMISNSQRERWPNVYMPKLPITSSRSSADICSELENLSLSTIDDSQSRLTSTTKIPPNNMVDFYSSRHDTLPKCPLNNLSNSPSYGSQVNGLRNCTREVDNQVFSFHPFDHQESLKDDPPICLGRRNSSASSIGSIQYVYTDTEDGYSLVETWYPTDDDVKTPSPSPSDYDSTTTFTFPQPKSLRKIVGSKSSDLRRQAVESRHNILVNGKGENCVKGSDPKDEVGPVRKVDSDIIKLSDGELRAELHALGCRPGPVTATTRTAYELQLMKCRVNPPESIPAVGNVYFPEIQRLLEGDLSTSLLQSLEDEMARPFYDLQPSRKWREGTKKSSFNYLLLDPRTSDNLPTRVKTIGDEEAFNDFIKAIFYIGKGKRARPYAHFKEAILHVNGCNKKAAGDKVQRILDIWNAGHGVVSLHVFQNVIPVEAYTREAAMIDALGRQKLTNIKAGEYYGTAASWLPKKRRALGSRLLHKAFRIFLSEGERHIRPADV